MGGVDTLHTKDVLGLEVNFGPTKLFMIEVHLLEWKGVRNVLISSHHHFSVSDFLSWKRILLLHQSVVQVLE